MNELIRICTFENNDLFPVKTINESSYQELKQDCDTITNAYSQFIVFKYFQVNVAEFKKCAEAFNKVPVTDVNINMNKDLNLLLILNKVIFNVLSSFNFFVDNGLKYLKRKYREPKVSDEFTLLTNKFYDNYFSYRFLWKLRHYYVHLGFPLVALNYDADLSEIDPEKRHGEIKLELYTEMLTMEKDIFKSNLCEEINKYGDTINLKPLIEELEKIGSEIQRYIYKCQKEELNLAIQNIETFVGQYKTKTNTLKITLNQEQKGRIHNMSIVSIPFDMISEYKETYQIT
ncbi:hypothetical protein DMB65_21315 [Flavobacterium cheongpyeongense]|uniref:Uncharacterized protein n=1 Tax=Flavobacterium cheongpyeongense TaxID=2212651 RepID=A0A2V4BIG0_9FLAO|nr:hypothetical protein [Flavobacterium cheongpyeongense]PXY38756.1 hypothetical protein DMB65_21315 [Flavobacterium cheongpyeongense]